MHDSVIEFVKKVLTKEDVYNRSILEVGSYDVNGSVRPYLESLHPASYLGVDMRPGKNVDIVCDACNLINRLSENRFDIVISTEMLEHVRHWYRAVDNMHRVCKRGGIVLITARGPGCPRHGYPNDFWRFTLNNFNNIFKGLSILNIESDTQLPGIFIKYIKTDGIDINRIRTHAQRI